MFKRPSLIIITLMLVLGASVPVDRLKVLSPKDLSEKFPKEGIAINIANYGYVPYGKNLMGTLYLVKPSLGCNPLETTIQEFEEPTPIFIMQRGNCSFVTKSRNAQINGAKMAVIVDNQPEAITSILMKDDGFGKSVSIPTIMISKDDGKIITDYIGSQDNTVSISLTFPLPTKNEKAKVEIWLSTSDKRSYELMKEISGLLLKMDSHIDLVPRYVTWHCSYCETRDYKVRDDKCLSGGRYCSPDPESMGSVTRGKDLVFEALRQICIFQNAPRESYFEYLKNYDEKCFKSANLTNCAGKLIEELKISQGDINFCITTSFVKTGPEVDMGIDDNWILSKQHQAFGEESIQIWPSIIVNDMTFRGNIDEESVLEAICEGFFTQPSLCLKIDVKVNYTTSEGIPLSLLLPLIVVPIIVIMVLVLVLYKRHMKREMDKDISVQVNTALSQYFALSDRSFHASTNERGSTNIEKPDERSQNQKIDQI